MKAGDDSRGEALRSECARRYGVDPATVAVAVAPYRVCPLGAHVDHQLGRVTAMALDEGVRFAFAPLDAPHARIASLDFPGEVRVDFAQVEASRPGDWGNFPRGAVRALQQRAPLPRGLVGITQGTVAEGGLSSSAAVGVAYLLALEHVNELRISALENVRLDQAIENDYLGLRNGVLDQSAILLSRRDHLTVLDCRTLTHECVPAPRAMPPFRVLIAFSGVRQQLVNTDYNRRVEECRAAAQTLLAAAGRPAAEPLLGNLSADEYVAHRQRLEGAAARRAAHFFSEQRRVSDGAAAWLRGDLRTFGRLMTASGHSSIVNYECGAPPLIDLYQLLIEADGVYGARFSGAGFRGCCVALADPKQADAAAAAVRAAYVAKHPELAAGAAMIVCGTDDGARVTA